MSKRNSDNTANSCEIHIKFRKKGARKWIETRLEVQQDLFSSFEFQQKQESKIRA